MAYYPIDPETLTPPEYNINPAPDLNLPVDYRQAVQPNTQVNAPAMLPPTAHQPITDPYEQYAQAMHGQASQAYEKHLQQFPQYQSPGIFNKIVAGLGGASAGYFGGAGEGLKVGQAYLNAPYHEQISRWQQQNQPLAQAAGIEARQAGHLLDPMRLYLQQQHQQAQDKAAAERAAATTSQAETAAERARIAKAAAATEEERQAKLKEVEATTKLRESQAVPKPGKQIERTIDLGNKQRVIYTDGTKEDLPKGITPGTAQAGQGKDFKEESAMRKEFTSLPEVKTFQNVDAQMGRVNKAVEEASRPGAKMIAVDQTLITVLNKMLDPSSVVRESEYARTGKDQALLDSIKGKINKITTGGAGLEPTEREALVRMIKNFHQVAKAQYDAQAGYYSDLATRYGHDPRNIVRLGGGTSSKPSGAPLKTIDEAEQQYLNSGAPTTPVDDYVKSKMKKFGQR